MTASALQLFTWTAIHHRTHLAVYRDMSNIGTAKTGHAKAPPASLWFDAKGLDRVSMTGVTDKWAAPI